jgi:hypothetical protein
MLNVLKRFYNEKGFRSGILTWVCLIRHWCDSNFNGCYALISRVTAPAV